MNRTHPTWHTRGRLRLAADRLRDTDGHLADWYAKQAVQGMPYALAGHNALTAIDAAMRALDEARAALVAELQRDEAARQRAARKANTSRERCAA